MRRWFSFGLAAVVSGSLLLALFSGCAKGESAEQMDFLNNIPRSDYIRAQEVPSERYDITDYGASTEKSGAENAQAINRAIDQASVSGGGTVYVPDGEFATSTVRLRDNVTLFIAGTLRSVSYEENRNSGEKLAGGLIYAENAKNIEICGGGRIDGNGESFCEEPERIDSMQPMETFALKEYILGFRKRIRFEKKDSGRVDLIHFEGCENVEIHDIELYRSAHWTCHIKTSHDVKIYNMVINNNFHVSNTDGIDINCSQRVTVEDCFIVTGDDGLCIKADGEQDVEDITFRRCAVMSLANCFKIGTTVYRNVSNVTVEDCRFFVRGTTGGYAGISIQSDCGGEVRNITVRNITMENVASPLLLWLGNRNGQTPGRLDGILIENVKAENVDLPSSITGTIHEEQNYRVTNVTIRDFNASYRECAEKLHIRRSGVGYQSMDGYPEITRVSHIYFISHALSFYWDLPVFGLFARHVDGLSLEKFHVTPRAANTRPADNITDPEGRIDAANIIIQ